MALKKKKTPKGQYQHQKYQRSKNHKILCSLSPALRKSNMKNTNLPYQISKRLMQKRLPILSGAKASGILTQHKGGTNEPKVNAEE